MNGLKSIWPLGQNGPCETKAGKQRPMPCLQTGGQVTLLWGDGWTAEMGIY